MSGAVTVRVRPNCRGESPETSASRSREVAAVVDAPLAFETVRLPDAHDSLRYTGTIRVVGGTAPASVVVRNLPPGLTAAPDGRITGATDAVGTHTLDVTAHDPASSTVTARVLLVVGTGPITHLPTQPRAHLPVATVGRPYCADMPDFPTGLAGVTWSIQSDPIPGIFITEDGGLCGVPRDSESPRLDVLAFSTTGQITRHEIVLSARLEPSLFVDAGDSIPCCDDPPSCSAVQSSGMATVGMVALAAACRVARRRRAVVPRRSPCLPRR